MARLMPPCTVVAQLVLHPGTERSFFKSTVGSQIGTTVFVSSLIWINQK